jgi:hypothetical protein
MCWTISQSKYPLTRRTATPIVILVANSVIFKEVLKSPKLHRWKVILVMRNYIKVLTLAMTKASKSEIGIRTKSYCELRSNKLRDTLERYRKCWKARKAKERCLNKISKSSIHHRVIRRSDVVAKSLKLLIVLSKVTQRRVKCLQTQIEM